MFVGHSDKVELFKRTIKQGRLSHAYIFAGQSGIGKRLFAFNLAKALVCERGSFFSDCKCSACAQVDAAAHPDIYMYSGSELNIENIRAIAESAAMTPLSAPWKVFILDKAEVFSGVQLSAGNALLKTLEEPGSNSVFFLITDRYDLILPTIRSRSSLVRFAPLSVGEIRQVVADIRPDERFVDKAALLSNGSVEKTLLIMDSSATDIFDKLEMGDYVSFIESVMAEKDADTIKLLIGFTYRASLELYKKTGVYDVCKLGYYMLDILKRFNYNINLDLLKTDFACKVTEVFSAACSSAKV